MLPQDLTGLSGSSRATCLDCTRKHVSQAAVLMEEALQGYPTHRWLAVGHLAEASAESLDQFPALAEEIRKHRLAYMEDANYKVPVVELIDKATRLAGGSGGVAGLGRLGASAPDPGQAGEISPLRVPRTPQPPGQLFRNMTWGPPIKYVKIPGGEWGTDATAKTITVGNVTGVTALVLNSGTGGLDFNATGAGSVTVDAGATGGVSIDGFAASNLSATAATLSISTITSGALDVTSAGLLDIDAATALSINSSGGVINIGDDAVAQAINVGTGAAARTITIGNVTGATGIVLNTGSGNITISDATNFVLNTTTGTKIGTATTQKLGFWNSAPVVQQTSAALTNNVTAGGTTDVIADYTIVDYATDSTTIRNDIYQLARKLSEVVTALRLYGILG